MRQIAILLAMLFLAENALADHFICTRQAFARVTAHEVYVGKGDQLMMAPNSMYVDLNELKRSWIYKATHKDKVADGFIKKASEDTFFDTGYYGNGETGVMYFFSKNRERVILSEQSPPILDLEGTVMDGFLTHSTIYTCDKVQ